MFDIVVEDPNDPTGKGKIYVWQNSWGLSTRTIGVMVMTHGDNQGLVLPPRVASVQAVVVPCGVTAKNRQEMNDKCEELADTLRKVGVKARADTRDGYTPGYKFNDWEQKGVPLRLELGPADLAKSQTLSVRRDSGVKAPLALADIAKSVPELLETIQADMFKRAKEAYDERLRTITKWDDVVPALDNKCVVAMPWCEEEACEDDIKERSGRSYVLPVFRSYVQIADERSDPSLRTSVLPQRVPSHFAFPSIRRGSLPSSRARRSARRVAKTPSAGPSSAARIKGFAWRSALLLSSSVL